MQLQAQMQVLAPATRQHAPRQGLLAGAGTSVTGAKVHVQRLAARQRPRVLASSPLKEAAEVMRSLSSVDETAGKRYTVELKKPLGIVLQQNGDTSAPVVVAEVKPESSAEKQGVRPGDVLVATSGYTYTKEADYNEVWVKSGEKVVRLNARGESFKTISAAIRSHPGHIHVILEFQRPESDVESE